MTKTFLRAVPTVAIAITLSLLSTAPSAHASDEIPTTATLMRGSVGGYYGGEAASAYVILGLCGAYVTAGAVLVTRDSDFARGLGWPLLTVAALEGLAAAVYAIQVHREVEHYQSVLARDPVAFQREESAHIHGTTSRFIYYRLVEFAVTLAGIGFATYGFVANQDVWKGAGIGLVAIGVPLATIDTINNARAQHYEQRVNRMSLPVAVHIGPVPNGLAIGISGRF